MAIDTKLDAKEARENGGGRHRSISSSRKRPSPALSSAGSKLTEAVDGTWAVSRCSSSGSLAARSQKSQR